MKNLKETPMIDNFLRYVLFSIAVVMINITIDVMVG